MVRDIVIHPDKVLKTKSEEIQNINSDIVKLADDMLETMYKAPGVGLAANQVGVALRMVVIDTGHDDERGKNPIVLINPVIIENDGLIEWEEGCLSVPGMSANVKRNNSVVVKAIDLDEKEFTIEAEEFLAVVLQHELDHLDGILYFDRLSRLKRNIFLKKYKKYIESEIDETLARKIK